MHAGTDSVALRAGPVRNLFVALNRAGVDYVVLRGYLPLRELETSADIDVLVPRDQLDRAAAAVRAVGWLRRRLQDGKYPHVFFDFLGDGGRFAIVFDVVTGLNYGLELHELRNPAPVIARSGETGGVKVPDPWHAAFLLALHLLLDKGGNLLPHHHDRVRAHWALCRERPQGAAWLREDFGAAAQGLTEQFYQVMEAGSLESEVERLQVHARALPCMRARAIWARVHDLWTRVRRRLRRPVRVGLIGVDGSGKSTIAEEFRSSASMLPVGLGYLGHNDFRSGWFKWLLRKTEPLEATEPGDGPVGLRLLDLLKDALWPLEVRHRMRRTERGRAIVLYDRYPLPGLDPTTPGSVARKIAAGVAESLDQLTPPADVVLLMDGDARTLWERKKEYPLEVLIQTQERYRQMIADATCETYVIRTDGSLDKSLAEVLEVLAASPALRDRLYHGRA
ncbi:MAG: hypothetical protein WD942_06620 [Dehalococcoidia bacterium]